MNSAEPTTPSNLLDELTASVLELRAALHDVLAALQVDPARPQTLSRQLAIDKSLAWKISRLITSDQPGLAVQHLPGTAAIEIFLKAIAKRRVANDTFKRAADAFAALERVVYRHLGDRNTLELVMDGMPGRATDRLVVSRKLAFRGNSGIWGVQAKTRVNTAILAPSADAPDMLDMAAIGGWVDFRRLRAESRWALFRRRTYSGGESSRAEKHIPIDPGEPPDGPMLMRAFCSPSLPPIEAVHDESGELVYELGPSSVGNAGAFTCFFGSMLPKIGSRWADEQNDRGEFGAVISAPVEALQFDLLVHRACEFATRTRADVYGVLAPAPTGRHNRDLLPLDVPPTNLGRFPPVVDSPRVPQYGEIVDHVLARCGWNRADFIGLRFTIEYPPFPSTVVVSFPLEQRTV